MSELDSETRDAMQVIVRSILHDVTNEPDRIAEMWENYPEIGENDWTEICEQVTERCKSFLNEPNVYAAAYAHLAKRAEH